MRSITNADELFSLTKAESVELMNDIDCQGKHISKLCSVFRGTIIGNNHTISNIVVDDPVWGDEQKIALFNYLTHACIKNITIENVSFIIDKGVYTPNISALCTEASDSVLENITVKVSTSNGEEIPMIYESIGGAQNSLEYTCNNKEYKIYKYKEGSLYEGNN